MECVVNISEGRDVALLAEFDATVPGVLLDRHSDPDHHRSVFTLVGQAGAVADAARRLTAAAVERLSLADHAGAHPRIGVVDVAPFVPFLPGEPPPSDLSLALSLRDDFAGWCATELHLPAFLYGPQRTLPEVRRQAFVNLAPDVGGPLPHPTAGAVAVGARPVLVAYNVWVDRPEVARSVAAEVRGPSVRALGLTVGDRAQVSTNLIDPALVGPAELYDEVSRRVAEAGGRVLGAELVGLMPAAVLHAIPEARWSELGVAEATTVESRL
jgi:glutamate formiminotransferase / 5-formyltetrahydrofolate cyclo-ligase